MKSALFLLIILTAIGLPQVANAVEYQVKLVKQSRLDDAKPTLGRWSKVLTTTANGVLFLAQSTASAPFSLWLTDGTPEGTHQIKHQDPITAYHSSLVNLDQQVYFVASSEQQPYPSLWVSDGTSRGTHKVGRQKVAITTQGIEPIVTYHHEIFFFADNPSDQPSVVQRPFGNELWAASKHSVRLVKDINPGPQGSYINKSATKLVKANNQLYFYANHSHHGEGLWRSDGSSAGTGLVMANKDGLFDQLVNMWGSNKALYIAALSDGVHEQWVIDDQAPMGRLVSTEQVQMAADLSSHYHITASGDLLIGGATVDACTAKSLWLRTPKDTIKLTEMPSTCDIATAHGFVEYHDVIYFAADDSSHGRELWQTDLTAKGTRLAIDHNRGLDSGLMPWNNASSPALFTFNDRLFFTGHQNEKPDQLWAMGDLNRHAQAILVNKQANYDQPYGFVEWHNAIFFLAKQANAGEALFVLK